MLTKDKTEIYLELCMEGLTQNPEAFGTSYEDIINKKSAIEYEAHKLAQDENYTLGAFIDGNLIGIATLETKPYIKQEYKAQISSVYVTPKARGLGAAIALIKGCLELAKSLEVEQVMFKVIVGNDGEKVFINWNTKRIYK